MFFAGIETRGWPSLRKVKDGETTDDLYAVLTCPPTAGDPDPPRGMGGLARRHQRRKVAAAAAGWCVGADRRSDLNSADGRAVSVDDLGPWRFPPGRLHLFLATEPAFARVSLIRVAA